MRAFYIISTLSFLLASPSFAADLGQYRPGNPYQSVIAPGAGICESQCAGDAQCRSWNYVKANPNVSGVCEFNANDVPPVASAISISGSNSPVSSRRGVVPGGTNTIRVGTSPSLQTQSTGRTQTTSTRRIVREAVPTQSQGQTASTRRRVVRPSESESLTAQQNPYRQVSPPNGAGYSRQNLQGQNRPVQMPQTFKYDLGDQPSAPRTRTQRQGQEQQMAPRPQYRRRSSNRSQPYASRPSQAPSQQGAITRSDRRRQQGPSLQAPAMTQEQGYRGRPQGQIQTQNRGQGQAFPPQGNSSAQYGSSQYAQPSGASRRATMERTQQQAMARPSASQPIPRKAPMARRSATDPVTYREAESAPSRAQTSYRSQSQTRSQGLSAEQAHQSLFGKLNDDVQVPNSGAPVPNDPNAPIPTMSSRASGTVEQSGLAGGPLDN